MMKKVVFSALIGASMQLNALDLWEVYSNAVKQDAGLQLAQQQSLIDEQSAIEGKALLRPSVVATARAGQSYYKSDSPNYAEALSGFDLSSCVGDEASCLSDALRRIELLSSGSTNSKYKATDFGVSATQPLYDKERWHQYQKVKIITQRGALALKQAHGDLVYRTTEAYLTALQALNNLEKGKAEHTDLRRQMKFAQRQLQQGVGRASDLYELRSADQLKATQAQILQSGLRAALAELSGLMGRKVSGNELRRFAVNIPVVSLKPAGEEAWINLANKNNFQMKNAQLEVSLAEEETKLKKSARHPKVNFLATYNKSDTSGGQGFIPGSETKLVGIDVSAPLYLGGAIGAGQKKAEYQHAATLQNLRQQQQRLAITIRAMYAQIEGNVSTFKILNESLAAAQRAEKNLAKGAANGVVSVAEIMRAKKTTAGLRSQVDALRYEYLLNKLKLRQLVGVLNVRDIKAINSLMAG